MNEPVFFEDIVAGTIEEFGQYRVSRDEMIAFASRYDPQEMHLSDEGAAGNTVFTGMSASGVHTFAMTSRMIVEHAKGRSLQIVAGLGLDRMRMRNPVYAGDVLRMRTRIADTRPSDSRPDCGIMVTHVETLNQDSKSVLSYEAAMLIKRRGSA